MTGRLILLLALAALASGCAETVEAPSAALSLRACDDGGDGGVIIDGVCL